MTWFKVDDGFESHPKVLALYDGPHPADAIALWTLAGSWCGLKLTNGAVPRGFVARSPHRVGAAELVRVGLWLETPEGYQFHDWLKMNPSRDQVLADRESNRQRQADWYARKQKQKPNAVRNSVSNSVINSDLTGAPDPVPVTKEEKEEPSPRVREVQSDFSIGHDFMRNATGRFYAGDEWRRQLARIGAKPADEKRAVLAAIQADPWCKGNLSVDPTHVLKQWPKYAAGNPQPKPFTRSRFAGPSRVPTAEEYARDAQEKAPWDL